MSQGFGAAVDAARLGPDTTGLAATARRGGRRTWCGQPERPIPQWEYPVRGATIPAANEKLPHDVAAAAAATLDGRDDSPGAMTALPRLAVPGEATEKRRLAQDASQRAGSSSTHTRLGGNRFRGERSGRVVRWRGGTDRDEVMHACVLRAARSGQPPPPPAPCQRRDRRLSSPGCKMAAAKAGEEKSVPDCRSTRRPPHRGAPCTTLFLPPWARAAAVEEEEHRQAGRSPPPY